MLLARFSFLVLLLEEGPNLSGVVQSMVFSSARSVSGLLIHYFEILLESHFVVCGVLLVVVWEHENGTED